MQKMCATIKPHSQFLMFGILWGGDEREVPSDANEPAGYEETPCPLSYFAYFTSPSQISLPLGKGMHS